MLPDLSEEYGLSRDYKASLRLNAQHWTWSVNIGSLLDPKIETTDPNLRIADIGTGTGVWLIELGQSLPSTVQLDGFDISDAQYPPAEWLPSNIKLDTLDAFGDIPEELHSKYDIVHLRMFLLVIQSDRHFDKLLQNLSSMLKPGGALQWSDCDVATLQGVAAKDSTPLDNFNMLKQAFGAYFQNNGVDLSWTSRLSELFQKNGLKDTHFQRYPMLPQLRASWTLSQLTVFEEMSYHMLAKGAGGEERAKGLMSLVSKLEGDVAKGLAVVMDMVVCVGRKPKP